MEQYIYIFTIFLEIILAAQLCCAIIKLDNKIIKINNEVLELKDEIEDSIKTVRKIVSKFNRISGFITGIKHSKIKNYTVIIFDIISLFFLFKSYKTYKGLFKLKFIKKLFSYSVVRTAFMYVKQLL